LSITVNLTGSASPGIDYSTAPDAYFNVTIPANSASVTVTLNPITNPELEPGLPGDNGKENARLTVVPVASYYVNYDVSANTYADIWITDAPLPQVSVIANDPTAQEDSGNGIPDSGSFTLTRTGSLSLPLQVSYSMAGSSATNNTDYKLAAGSSSAGVVGNFPVGVATITVQVNAVWDDVIEGDESVVLLLNSTSTYQSTAPSNSATVTILDRPAPHVSIWTTANAQEEGTNGDPVQGAIRISRDGSTTTPLTVYFDVNGSGNTATKYVDYTGSILNGSAMIPTGASYVDVFVNPIQDTNFNEQFEHVVATLDAGSKYQIFGGVADLTIADTPARLISIVSNDSDASEQSGLGNTADTATFTLYRTGNFSHDLSVSLSYSGTASVTSDVTFSTPSTSTVIIPANLSFVTVTVTPKQDSNYSEGDENLQISVANSPNSNYTVSQPDTANIVIHDAPLPSVSVSTLLNTAQEEGLDGNPVAGSFQLTRTGSTVSSLTVSYQTSYVVGSSAGGTDFTLSAGPSSNGAAVATFPAGVSTITVLLNPVWDEIVEGNETIQFQVAASAAYTVNSLSNSGQVTIVDRLVPSVSIMTMNNAQEEGPAGSPVTGFVRISRTSGPNNHPLSVSYQVQASSTATPTTDYTGTILNGVAVIPAGASYVDVSVIPVQDNDYSESTENVNVALVASSKYQFFASSTSVAITNSPAPTVSLDATDPMAAEPVAGSTDTGTFTVTRVGHLTQSLTVQLNVSGTASSGTDYTSSPSPSGSTLTVTFNPGETSKTITITPLADQNYQEGTENVALSVSANAAYSVVPGHQQASVSIADAPDLATIDFTATVPSETSETSTNPMYMMMGAPPPAVATLTRTGRIDQAITVQVAVAGTATPGTDYTSTPSLSGSTITVQFAPYERSKSIQISAITDTLVEQDESVLLSISATTAYYVGTHQSANLTIHDNHSTVTVIATDNLASEPSGSYMMMPDTGTFIIHRQNGDLSQPLTVSFILGGSASSSDYTLAADYGITLTTTTVTIPAGQSDARLVLTPTADSIAEGLEVAVLSISAGSDYAIGSHSSDLINIGDYSIPVYVVTASDADATEPLSSSSMPDGAAFTITRLGGSPSTDSVTFSLSGTATLYSDYSFSGTGASGNYSISGNSITVGPYGATVYITPNADNDWTEGDETVVLHFQGQYANPQNSSLQQATVTIHPAVNNPPVISNLSSSASILEDSSGQTLYFSVNDQETSASSLTVQATVVPAGLVSVTVGNSGMGMPGYQQLQIVPLANQNGTATITVTVTDGNGTTTSQNVQVQVTPVNDAPSFAAGPGVSSNEDAGRQVIANWASSLSAGPANESSQTLSFLVNGYSMNGMMTGSLSDLFSEPPTISPSGTLSFKPALNKFGTAYLTAVVKDNGGTDYGGMDTSTPVSFSIVINQVNHEPTGTQSDLTNTEGDIVNLQLSATDVEDGTNLQYYLVSGGSAGSALPANLALDSTGKITGTIANTATETNGGHYQITVAVLDTSGTTGYITFNWTVLPPPPSQINVTATVSEVAEVKPSVVAEALASGSQLPFPTRFGYVVTRDGITIDPLTVVVDLGGTATYGSDFIAAPNQASNITFAPSSVIVDFPIGVSTLSFYFDVTDDSITEKDETAVAAVVTSPGSYIAGQYSQASVTIHDNDTTDKNATLSTALMPDCGCDSKLTVAKDGATADDVHVDYADGEITYDPWADFMGDIDYDEYAWLPMYFSGENPHPIISVDVQLPKSGPLPTKIDAVLKFGDTSSVPAGAQGAVVPSSPGFYRQQRFDVPAGATPGSIYRISLMADASALTTGEYDYQVQITNLYGQNASPSASDAPTTVLGSTPIFNQINSDLGNRWVIPGMSQIQVGADGISVLNGNASGAKYEVRAAAGGSSGSSDDSDSGADSTPSLSSGEFITPAGTFSTMRRVTVNGQNLISLLTPGEHEELYDPVTGMLLKRYDRLGQATTFDYVSLDGGPAKALSKVTLPDGRYFQYNYDFVPDPTDGSTPLTALGKRMASFTVFNGVNAITSTFEHDSAGRLTQITGPDADGGGANNAPVMNFAYDDTTNLLVKTTDPVGVDKVFNYGTGDDRRLRSLTIGGNAVWQLVPAEVQALTQMIPIDQVGATFTDASGESHKLQFDQFGSVLKDIDSEGNITQYVRYANSQITQMAAPDGAVTNYTYDQYGRTLSVTYPNGQSETWVYDATLRGDEPVSHTDANGHTETFSYDSHGNTLSHRDFTGAITTYPTYVTGNPTLEIQSAPGGDSSLGAIQTRLEYDPITNQITKATDLSTGKSTLHTYDPIDGSLKTDTDELGHTTTYNRDVWGRVLSMTQPDPDGPGPQLGPVTTYHYDDLGRLDTLTEPDGVVTHYQYNWQDEATQVQTVYPSVTEIDPITQQATVHAGVTTVSATTYNGMGLPVTDIDEQGNVTTYFYFSDGQVSQIIYPDPDGPNLPGQSPVESFIEDSVTRHITSHTDILGHVTTYQYDTRDRVMSQTDYLGGVTTFVLDGNGNVLSTHFQSQISPSLHYDTSYQYDGEDRITQETDEYGHTTSYSFDNWGQLWYTTPPSPANGNPDTPVAKNEYDSQGRLIKTHDSTGRTTVYAYDDVGDQTQVTAPDGTSTQSTYDALGRKTTTKTTADGRITSYFYNTKGQLASSTDPDGVISYIAYDVFGDVSKITTVYPTPTGSTPIAPAVDTFSYDSAGNLLSETSPTGSIGYHYDLIGQLVSQTDSTGLMLEYKYDVAGRVIAIKNDADNSTTNFAYNDTALTVTETDPTGLVTKTWTDELGRTTKQVLPDGTFHTMQYPSANEQVVADALGNQTHYLYDNLDRLIKVTDALGNATSMTYDADGNIASMTDANGNTVTMAYDSEDRMTSRGSGSNVETWAYDDTLHTVTYVDILGRTTISKYDVAGRLQSVTDPLNGVTTYQYDSASRVTQVTGPDPDGSGPLTSAVTQYQYDANGRTSQITNAKNDHETFSYNSAGQVVSATDFAGHTTQFTYDSRNGQVKTVTDPLNQVTTYAYDTLGRLTKVTDPTGATTVSTYSASTGQLIQSKDADNDITHYTYDAVGNLKTLTDPGLNQTTWTYDADNRPIGETTTDGTRTYIYDRVGNLSSETDRDGHKRKFDYQYVYDGHPDYKLTAEFWFDAAGTTVTRDIAYGYTSHGQLTSVSDPSATNYMAYDALGRLVVAGTLASTLDPKVVLTYGYQPQNRQSTVSAQTDAGPDFVNTNTYDALGELVQVTQQGVAGVATVAPKRVDFAYNQVGQVSQIDRFADLNGTQPVADSAYSYRADGSLQGLTYTQATGSNHTNPVALNGYNWTYDTAGRITGFNSPDGTTTYSYDAAGQLQSAVSQNPTVQPSTTYTYDANGNRTMSGYLTAANNRVTSDGTYNYQYDHEGHRIKQTEIATGKVTSYTWDFRGRLTDITYQASSYVNSYVYRRIHYTYDGFDRLINKEIDTNGDGTYETSESYVYDGANIVLVLNSAGSVTNRYLQGPGVDQVLADEQVSTASQTPNTVLWALSDNQGTVRDWAQKNTTTGQTQIVDHIVYDAYGQIVSQTNPQTHLAATNKIRFGYTGQIWDADAKLYYYRARWYDPHIGKFTSEDPLGFAAGDTNVQRYVGNSPTNATDPSGMEENPTKGLYPNQEASASSSLDDLTSYFEENPDVYDAFEKLPNANARLKQLEDWGWQVSPRSMWTDTYIDGADRTAYFDTTLGTMSWYNRDDDELGQLIYNAIMDEQIRAPKTATSALSVGKGLTHFGQKTSNAGSQAVAIVERGVVDVRNQLLLNAGMNAGVTIGLQGVLKFIELRRVAKLRRAALKQSQDAALKLKNTTHPAPPVCTKKLEASSSVQAIEKNADAKDKVGQLVGTRNLPDNELPWRKYQVHVTGQNYEEVWQLSQRKMASDGRRAGYLVEAKWTGKNDAAWRSSPYNPAHEFYDESKMLDQVRGYLELHSTNGSKGIRFAVSNNAAQKHFEQLFRANFKENLESGLLKVFHVPGTGM
jgi:RHS repeat-associated protein